MARRKFRELDKAIVTITRSLKSEGSELVHDRALEELLRELNALKKGGPYLSRKQVGSIVGRVAKLACERLLKRDARR